MAKLTGTANADYLVGTAGADEISGLGGNDTLIGGDGADKLDGGDGDDIVQSANNLANPVVIGGDEIFGDIGTEIDVLTGGRGNDKLYIGYGDSADGGAGTDTISANFLGATAGVTFDLSKPTQIIGGGTITGIEGFNTLTGSNFDDVLNGYGGVFGGGQIRGMGGDDHLIGGYFTFLLDGGSGNDTIDIGAAVYGPTIRGGDGDDIINAVATNPGVVYGGAGNDTINTTGETYGEDGSDHIVMHFSDYGNLADGGAGDDLLEGVGSFSRDLTGGAGADTLIGGDEGDYLASDTNFADDNADHDTLLAGGGDDYLRAGYGDDIDGGSGIDTLRLSLLGAKSGVTVQIGAMGTDAGFKIGGGTIRNVETVFLTGSAFADTISAADAVAAQTVGGGAGDDVITSGAFSLTATGDAGNDRFVSGTAADKFNGGDGIDTIDYHLYAKAVTVTLAGPGISGSGADGDTLLNFEKVIGSGFADQISGAAGDDTLLGMAGNDVLVGGGGKDLLDGGKGADAMTGGAGDDRYVVDNAGDTVIEQAGEGRDTVTASIGYTLAANVEDLLLAGRQDIAGTGNEADNRLTGNRGANDLKGLGGADQITGGGGTDTMDGGADGDVYLFAAAADHTAAEIGDTGATGTDVVRFTAKTAQTLILFAGDTGIERAETSGSAALSIDAHDLGNAIEMVGNAKANTLTGTAFADRIDGGVGADTLIGGAGDDTYLVDNSGDVVSELAGGGSDTVLARVNYTLPANIEFLTLTGSAAINGTGSDDANVITGNAGSNRLDGRGGADTLLGGKGDDVLDGGAGQDTLDGGEGSDVYLVTRLADQTAAEIFDSGKTGTDEVRFAAGSGIYTAFAGDRGIERYSLVAGTAAIGIDASALGHGTDIVGNDGANTLTGSGYADTITGGAGNDTLKGNAGADTLDGGLGADSLAGGAGDDRYVVDNAGDAVTEQAGEGRDLVTASLDWTLSANVEDLTLTGSALRGTGNSGDNTITGTAGTNVLEGGGGGKDVLIGGQGDDTYLIDGPTVTVKENGGEGFDRMVFTTGGTMAANVEVGIAGGKGAVDITGTAGDDLIGGNAAANVLSGGSGNDTLIGHLGKDTLLGGDGNDFLLGGTEGDTLTGGAGNDQFAVAALSGVTATRITDFTSGVDTLLVVNPFVSGLLLAGGLAFGTSAKDADDVAIYDQASGNLWADFDGNGPGAKLLVATLAPGTALAASDILLIDQTSFNAQLAPIENALVL